MIFYDTTNTDSSVVPKATKLIKKENKSVQVNLFKSSRTLGTQTERTLVFSEKVSALKLPKMPETFLSSPSSVSSTKSSKLSTIYSPSASFSSESSTKDVLTNKQILEYTLAVSLKDSKYYLGIEPFSIQILDILVIKINISKKNVILVLRKIRLNEGFKVLGDLFCITKRHAANVFSSNVAKIASHLNEFICWHEKDKIKEMMPLAFKNRFKNVESIIDCFELFIEKPKNSIKQSTSYSSYKVSNGIKYFISCEPTGHINFISSGHAARQTDEYMVTRSGFLDIIPKQTVVLADRGFKQCSVFFEKKGCDLQRPPSVKVSEKPSKGEVKLTKRIAAVRIHIERAIGRVRFFKILAPGTILNNKFCNQLDFIVIIACGLANLQGPLIK